MRYPVLRKTDFLNLVSVCSDVVGFLDQWFDPTAAITPENLRAFFDSSQYQRASRRWSPWDQNVGPLFQLAAGLTNVDLNLDRAFRHIHSTNLEAAIDRFFQLAEEYGWSDALEDCATFQYPASDKTILLTPTSRYMELVCSGVREQVRHLEGEPLTVTVLKQADRILTDRTMKNICMWIAYVWLSEDAYDGFMELVAPGTMRLTPDEYIHNLVGSGLDMGFRPGVSIVDWSTGVEDRSAVVAQRPAEKEITSTGSGRGNAYFVNDAGEIVIVADGRMVTVPEDHPKRDDIRRELGLDRFDSALELADRFKAVARFFEGGGHEIEDDGYQIRMDGEPLPEAIGRKAVDMLDAGLEPQPLLRFLDKLKQNPKPSIQEELLPFLAANDFCIDEDGLIVAWKKVARGDGGQLTDLWTQELDYTPPATVTMPRDAVNDDPAVSCSAGLHFATWGFSKGYGGTGDDVEIVELRVNPRDVVSVPRSHRSKGRCCTFTIEKLVHDWRQRSADNPPIPAGGVLPSSAEAPSA